MSVNEVTIMGYLGKDPELKVTQGGNQVATFSVATSESWVKDGKKEEKTEWHNCVVWGKTAENIAKYFRKGSGIYIRGKLQTRSWEDQQGQKRYTTEIIVATFQFPPKGPTNDNAGNSNTAARQRQNNGPSDSDMPQGGNFGSDDDVPF
jgi:single-strand DNA-binding protein